MSDMRRESRSPYMEWAKLSAGATFNLATSGVANLPFSALPVTLDDLEITGADPYGYGELKERLAAKAGVAVENIVTAVGTSMANHLAIAAFLEPGDEVLIEQPSYGPLLDAAEYLGARVRRFPRRFEAGWEIDPEAVDAALSDAIRLVVVTNYHNPTGVRTPDQVLVEIARLAAQRGAWLLVDEVYVEACFDPDALSAFHLGPNVVATGSLTKAYGLSGLRCGWIVAPREEARRMWRINDLYGATPVHLGERVSVVALDHLDEIAAAAEDRLTRNRELLDRFLSGREDLEVVRPAAGTIVFPRLAYRDADETERFVSLLRERYETSVVPGRFFEEPRHFRLGIGGASAMVEQGLERLGRALDDFADSSESSDPGDSSDPGAPAASKPPA